MRSRQFFSRRFAAVLLLAIFPVLRAFRRTFRLMGIGIDETRPLAEVIPLAPYLNRTRVVRKARAPQISASTAPVAAQKK
jgi:hypothetical protein